MKGLHETSWRCGEARSRALLAPFSTSLPLGLRERLLRVAARRLGLCERDIAIEAIERLLDEEGF